MKTAGKREINLKKVAKSKVAIKKDKVKVAEKETKKDFWGRLGNFVKKAIDCCLE